MRPRFRFLPYEDNLCRLILRRRFFAISFATVDFPVQLPPISVISKLFLFYSILSPPLVVFTSMRQVPFPKTYSSPERRQSPCSKRPLVLLYRTVAPSFSRSSILTSPLPEFIFALSQDKIPANMLPLVVLIENSGKTAFFILIFPEIFSNFAFVASA